MNHAYFISACCQLARLGGLDTGLNPLVGALLVRKGEVIAHGVHLDWGQPHAEQALLAEFSDVNDEDVLYVNLEPCCHHGKTPACCELIAERGIKTVVFGMLDPNPKVAGKGIEYLQQQGVKVIGPVLPSVCRRLNRGFVSVHEKGRPWITLKSARTQDGKIANEDGSPLKITSEQQDKWSHQYLRAQHDAILIGVQTVITDNPSLTVRNLPELEILKEPYFKGNNLSLETGKFRPWKIVLDPKSRMPKDARLIDDKTIAMFDLDQLMQKCLEIGIKSILVEGGQKTWDSFKKAQLMDEEVSLIGN